MDVQSTPQSYCLVVFQNISGIPIFLKHVVEIQVFQEFLHDRIIDAPIAVIGPVDFTGLIPVVNVIDVELGNTLIEKTAIIAVFHNTCVNIGVHSNTSLCYKHLNVIGILVELADHLVLDHNRQVLSPISDCRVSVTTQSADGIMDLIVSFIVLVLVERVKAFISPDPVEAINQRFEFLQFFVNNLFSRKNSTKHSYLVRGFDIKHTITP